MKFKLDENLSGRIAAMLRAQGHDAVTVRDQGLLGSDDETVAAHVQAEARALITLDRDFGDVRAYPPSEYPGLIVLRVKAQSRLLQLRLARSFLPLLRTERLPGTLWVVEPDRVRIVDPSQR